ncbi:DNA repair protein RAD51 homolog 4 isoform X3 [Hemicordylus capensis]|uniref:DNA repair protein RAD51 homolog 4 isoform X3 n=1 Tax=Hemicordylus capensis TaxID=884348 RepID=UPI002304C1E0|nr:DNA repair protein RAD51 homolog 4 isoform X3 [Hemicordylus capensis]
MILHAGLCPGLTAEMARLLKANGIRTVVDLVSSDLEETAQKCSLSYKALVAIRRVLLAQFSAFPVNGAELYEELKSATAILSTGSKSVDKLLDSGLYTGEMTEFVGASGSGKTQVCLKIAATVSQSLRQGVLYLDSMGGFTASRLLQMLQGGTEKEEEQAAALQRIQVVCAFDAYTMLDALQDVRSSMAQQVISASGPVRVVVVDSISAVISPLLGSRHPDGDQPCNQRCQQWSLQASAGTLLEFCAQHPGAVRAPRGAAPRKSQCLSDGVLAKIPPAARWDPGGSGPGELGA